ncbi:hypothetical protein [Chroococcidiopsis sp.]|uniref:hypothetical protein n=1 Tax=Chroococcidiopsis sp. TaxID=3088168 RepID=UPI003F3DEA86
MPFQVDYSSREQALAKAIVDEMIERGVNSGGGGGGGSGDAIASGENFIGSVGGKTTLVQATLTRPADTTVYAANDAITNSTSTPQPINFASSARIDAGSGVVVGARLTKNNNNLTNASFRLWLYAGVPGVPNDNATFAQQWADRTVRLGYIDFTSPIQGADCVSFIGAFPNNQYAFKLNGGTSLFGILQALAAYGPASGEQFFIELAILQD